VNGIVNRSRAVRARSLPAGSFVKRTAKSQILESRGQLGQGAYTYGEYGEYGPLVEMGILGPTTETPTALEQAEVTEWPEAIPLVYTWPAQVRLSLGDRGDQVRELQTQLRRLGFGYSKVDGIFGALTEQAVRQFQGSLGLPATGQVDEVTWAALQSAVPALPSGGIPTTPTAPVTTALAPIEREIRTVVAPGPAAPPSPAAPAAAAEAKVVLGLPTGFWVAIGAIVLALFATATPGPAPPPRKVLRA
jgi:hypothetical protein